MGYAERPDPVGRPEGCPPNAFRNCFSSVEMIGRAMMGVFWRFVMGLTLKKPELLERVRLEIGERGLSSCAGLALLDLHDQCNQQTATTVSLKYRCQTSKLISGFVLEWLALGCVPELSPFGYLPFNLFRLQSSLGSLTSTSLR